LRPPEEVPAAHRRILPDEGRFAILILLQPTATGTFEGTSNDRNGNAVRVRYSHETGLTIGD